MVYLGSMAYGQGLQAMAYGLRQGVKIHMSHSDFCFITEDGTVCVCVCARAGPCLHAGVCAGKGERRIGRVRVPGALRARLEPGALRARRACIASARTRASVCGAARSCGMFRPAARHRRPAHGMPRWKRRRGPAPSMAVGLWSMVYGLWFVDYELCIHMHVHPRTPRRRMPARERARTHASNRGLLG